MYDFAFDYAEPQETLAAQTALGNLIEGNCDSEQTEDDERFFSTFETH